MTNNSRGGTVSGPLHFGYDFNPPPGPGGFGGAPPPPPPGYMQPTPLGPGARQEGPKTWLYFLLGCGCLLLIGVVGFVGCGYYAVAKLPQLMAGAAKLGKAEYLAQLSEDHAQEQTQRFEYALDTLNDNTEAFTSFIDYLEAPNQPLYERLNIISEDGSISVEESQAWATEVESALGIYSAPGQDQGGDERTESEDDD